MDGTRRNQRNGWPGAAAAGCAALLIAAAGARASGTDLQSLVDAERAFARQSVEHGMRSAFLENLASDAILFRGGPVNGRRLWQTRDESPARLAWAPSFAEISGSRDFGFTTGPWTLAASADTAPSAFGHFVSVWRREREGPWRVALDIGVSHADPGTPLERVEVTPGPAHARPESLKVRGWDVGGGVRRGNTSVGVGTGGVGVGVGVGSGGFGIGLGTGGTISRRDAEWRRMQHEKNRLMSAERKLGFEARKRGWDAAYRAVAAGDLRTYREGRSPALGVEAAAEWSAEVPRNREWLPRGHAVAPSWDLGYAYGLAIARPGRTSPGVRARPDTASYVHLWRKDDAGEWRLMLDIENPHPRR